MYLYIQVGKLTTKLYSMASAAVTIPESVESLGNMLFYGTPVNELIIEGDNTRFDDTWSRTGLPWQMNPSYTVVDDYQFLPSIGTIVGYSGLGGELVIPSELDDVTVTGIETHVFYGKGF